MSQELEFEAKSIVDASEYLKLLEELELTHKQPVTQHNHYFETSDFLFRQFGSALRIREKNETYTLTLKQPAPNGGLLETHQKITKEEKRLALETGSIPLGEVSKQIHLLELTEHPIQYLGTLTTERIELPHKKGTLFLDKSSYLQTTDYEIEYEGPSLSYAQNTLTELLNEQDIPSRSALNKVARFFKRKSELE